MLEYSDLYFWGDETLLGRSKQSHQTGTKWWVSSYYFKHADAESNFDWDIYSARGSTLDGKFTVPHEASNCWIKINCGIVLIFVPCTEVALIITISTSWTQGFITSLDWTAISTPLDGQVDIWACVRKANRWKRFTVMLTDSSIPGV